MRFVHDNLPQRVYSGSGEAGAHLAIEIANRLAKAVAMTTGLPIVVVPTAYSGLQGDRGMGLTQDSRKLTGTDPQVLPKVFVYEPHAFPNVAIGYASGGHEALTSLSAVL